MIVFACTETSGIATTASDESTSAQYNSSLDRCGLPQGYTGRIILNSALLGGRMKFIRRSGAASNTGALATLYSADGVGRLRYYKTSSSAWQMEYYNGSAWVKAFDMTYATNSVVAHEISWTTGTATNKLKYYYQDQFLTEIVLPVNIPAITYVDLNVFGGSSAGNIEMWSNIILADLERSLAEVYYETEGPNANGLDLGTTGTYLDVDEAVNDGYATMVQLAAAGNRASFRAPARTYRTAANAGARCLAVTVAADLRAGEDVTLGPQYAKFYLLLGGVRYYSPSFALSTTGKGYQYSWNTNPATGLAWDIALTTDTLFEWGVEAADS